jgi:hypothetical protein
MWMIQAHRKNKFTYSEVTNEHKIYRIKRLIEAVALTTKKA